MDLLYIILVTATILSTLLLFVVFNLNRKLNVAKAALQDSVSREEYLTNVIGVMATLATSAYNNMVKIDKRETFASDDEVGFTFKAILETVKTLADQFNKLNVKEED